MFGFPSDYYYPQQYYRQPTTPRRAAPSYSSYDPFGFGDRSSYYQPPHRPQQHTSYNPYSNPLSNYQRDSDEESGSSSEEEEYLQRPRRVLPQQQIRLDKPPEQLIPQKRQAQKHPQQSRPQHPQQAQQHPPQHHQQAHHAPQHPQQAQPHTSLPIHIHSQHPQQQQPQRPTKPIRKVDLDQEARRIQRRWRGYSVRKLDIVNKLRAIKKIESEVDTLISSPSSQEILNIPLEEPLPQIDTNYVGKVPRCVMALEHELTTKLLALDGISGGADIVRQRRKSLVSKIEGILSRVDPIKKAYTNSPHHPPKVEPMETEPLSSSAPTPSSIPSSSSIPTSSSLPEYSALPTSSSDSSTESSTDSDTTGSSTTVSEMETEEPLNKKKQSPLISDAPMDTIDGGDTTAVATSGPSFVESMGSMDIQDSSSPSTPISTTPLSTPLPSSSPSSRPIPSLKQMCYKLCDQLIKKALV